MTSTPVTEQKTSTPPPPPPAEITYSGQYSVNPLAEVSFRRMCAQIPAVLARIARLSWRTDRRAVQLLLGCQLVTGVSAAVLLTATARAMGPVLGAGSAGDRLRGALPALLVVALVAALARAAGVVAAYAERRITPLLTTVTDSALVEAVCRVEAVAYAEDGFSDRREAAEMGVTRTHVMVADAQRFVSAVIRMVTAGGVLSVLNPLLVPLLLLAVLPAGVGAVLSARVDYQIHYGNIADRNVRGMMRWWATESKYSDEVRANSMSGYLVYWYRALSDRCDRRTLAAAPRILRIGLLSALAGGVFLVATWGALAWLAVSGRIDLAVAATAVIAVQTTLAALSGDVGRLQEKFAAVIASDHKRGGQRDIEQQAAELANMALKLQNSGSATQRVRSSLYATAAAFRSSAMWAATDGRRFKDAIGHMREAQGLAELSGDQAIKFRIWSHAGTLYRHMGRPTDARAANDVARTLHITRRDPMFASLGMARQMAIQGVSHELRSLPRIFDQAQEAMHRADPNAFRPVWLLAFWDEAELHSLALSAHLAAGDWPTAEYHAHQCLASLRPHMQRSRAIATSRLAQAQLAQGDVDTATHTAMKVKSEAATQHPRVSRMLQEFGAALRATAPGSPNARTWTEHTAAWRAPA